MTERRARANQTSEPAVLTRRLAQRSGRPHTRNATSNMVDDESIEEALDNLQRTTRVHEDRWPVNHATVERRLSVLCLHIIPCLVARDEAHKNTFFLKDHNLQASATARKALRRWPYFFVIYFHNIHNMYDIHDMYINNGMFNVYDMYNIHGMFDVYDMHAIHNMYDIHNMYNIHNILKFFSVLHRVCVFVRPYASPVTGRACPFQTRLSNPFRAKKKKRTRTTAVLLRDGCSHDRSVPPVAGPDRATHTYIHRDLSLTQRAGSRVN